MTDLPPLAEAYAGSLNRPPLLAAGAELGTAKAQWRQALTDQLYGPIPAKPRNLTCTSEPCGHATRLILTMALPGGTFDVDAALWLPDGPGPHPLICGLDFIGPAGILTDTCFPLDPDAIIVPRSEHGSPDGRLTETLRGTSAPSWPITLLTDAGYAVIVSCYGSWVPDDPVACSRHGLAPLMPEDTGAISLWAWSISRLIDAGLSLPQIDPSCVIVAGHSRLGKAALWATANDRRITATFANSSGAAGAALTAHARGETLAQLQARFPHWLRPDAVPNRTTIDQDALIALAHPGALYLGQSSGDLWADPLGSYMALRSAASVWPGIHHADWPLPSDIWRHGQTTCGPLGFHLRAGDHALLPSDWHGFLAFMNATRTTACSWSK